MLAGFSQLIFLSPFPIIVLQHICTTSSSVGVLLAVLSVSGGVNLVGGIKGTVCLYVASLEDMIAGSVGACVVNLVAMISG